MSSGILLPPGWFSAQDIREYRLLYADVPFGGTTAEIGVWQGRSLCSVADVITTKDLQVSAIDTFLGTPAEFETVHDCDGTLQARFELSLARFNLLNRVKVIRSDSVSASELFSDCSLNLVFLDADHAEQSVVADLHAWLPKLKPEGVLAGHDYRDSSVRGHGVKAALARVFSSTPIRTFRDSSLWALKKHGSL